MSSWQHYDKVITRMQLDICRLIEEKAEIEGSLRAAEALAAKRIAELEADARLLDWADREGPHDIRDNSLREELCREMAGSPPKVDLETAINTEIVNLRNEVARLTTALLRRGVSYAPCDVCGYNGAGYWQPDKHRCVHDAAIIVVQDRAEQNARQLDALRGEAK